MRFQQTDGRPEWGEPYYPWQRSSDVIRAIRRLASASKAEVTAFYRRFGPLGYPDWARLRGEPLEWLRWQARKLDLFLRLEDGFRNDDSTMLLDLIRRNRTPVEPFVGESFIALPDAHPGAIEIPLAGGVPPKSQVMRAARVALTNALRDALEGVQIVPADDWQVRRRGSTVRIVGTFGWAVPTLLQAIYLLAFLGHQLETPVRFCALCAAPYLTRGEGYPPTCSPKCSDVLRHRRFRANRSPNSMAPKILTGGE